MQETLSYLDALLKDKDTVIVGLSGGPDSMCLLNILLSLNKNLRIVCAHINHGIRNESIDEMDFITEYCRERSLTLETVTFDKKSDCDDYNELELREKRYLFFEELYKKYNAKYLFTAHHGDDLIETILMRMTRGSNLKGYTGFQVQSIKNEMSVVKPLIFMTKDEIEQYNKDNNIPFVVDKTNLENEYTRNRYRHNILPFLKEENKNVHTKYLKFSNELFKYYEYVNNVVLTEINARYKDNVLDISNFDQLDSLVQTKIIEYALDDHYVDNLYLVSDKHVNMILDMISNIKPNMEINLPDNLLIIKSYDKIKITRDSDNSGEYYIEITDDCILPNGRHITKIKDTDKSSNYYIKLNSKEISLPLYVRSRKNGDKMIIKNMTSYKKIKDILIDSKVPISERNALPVVVDSTGEVIWLPGLKKSKFDKANNEKYDIILWYN